MVSCPVLTNVRPLLSDTCCSQRVCLLVLLACVSSQGAGSLQRMVEGAAKTLGGKVVSGPAYDVTTNKKEARGATHSFLGCVPLPCCVSAGAPPVAPFVPPALVKSESNETELINQLDYVRSVDSVEDIIAPTPTQEAKMSDAICVEDVDNTADVAPLNPSNSLTAGVRRLARLSKEAFSQGPKAEEVLFSDDTASYNKMSRFARASRERLEVLRDETDQAMKEAASAAGEQPTSVAEELESEAPLV